MRVVSKKGTIYYVSNNIKKSRKSAVLVDTAGKVRKKAVEAFKLKIDARTDLSDLDKRMLKADLDNYTAQAKGEKRSHSMTENSFLAHNEENRTDRMLANLGYNTKSLAEELGVEEEALAAGTWNFKAGTFTVDGEVYDFKFRYVDSAFTKRPKEE